MEIEKIYKRVLLAKKTAKQNNKVLRPGPWRITFDTNPDHCNFNCVMCECFSPYSDVKKERVEKGLHKRVMNIDLIRNVLSKAQGTPLREIIPSTMGEPLLYKDFDKIIDMCKEFQIKLNLTTNGSFPVRGVEEWAHKLMPVLSDVKISWNGATKETHESIMIGSKWDIVLNNLKTFLKIRDAYALQKINRATVTLQLTFLESNLNELEDIVRMGIELGIDRIKGHHLWAHFNEIKNLSMRKDYDSIERWNKIVSKIKVIAKENPLKNGQSIKLENFDLLQSDAIRNIAKEGVCPFLGKEAWINTEGEFSPCCAPDKQRKTLGQFGNVKNTSLENIWNSEAYHSLKKNYQSYELCKGCNMKKSLMHANI